MWKLHKNVPNRLYRAVAIFCSLIPQKEIYHLRIFYEIPVSISEKENAGNDKEEESSDDDDEEPRDIITQEPEDDSLQFTGRLFGGLVADVKRKLPWFVSDFKDAFHIQTLSSIIYIYLGKYENFQRKIFIQSILIKLLFVCLFVGNIFSL